MLNHPDLPGLWTRDGKFYRVWREPEYGSLIGQHIDVDGCTGQIVWTLPTGNWRKLTAASKASPFTPTKSTWQAGKEFLEWLGSNWPNSPKRIAEKALKIFSECGESTEAMERLSKGLHDLSHDRNPAFVGDAVDSALAWIATLKAERAAQLLLLLEFCDMAGAPRFHRRDLQGPHSSDATRSQSRSNPMTNEAKAAAERLPCSEKIWLAAHELAATEMPRLQSGICQQPGLAAAFAIFAEQMIREHVTDHVEDLLKPPHWHEFKCGDFSWQTSIGGYHAIRHDTKWIASFYYGKLFEIRECDTADDAKAACWSDYVSRMRAAFRNNRK